MSLSCPWALSFPPPSWAQGLPWFWVPLAGLLLMVAVRSFLKELGGTPPNPPGRGRSPLHPKFSPPSWAQGLPRFWVPLVGNLPMLAVTPSLKTSGAHPPDPLQGTFALCVPNFPRLRGLCICHGFGFERALGIPRFPLAGFYPHCENSARTLPAAPLA